MQVIQKSQSFVSLFFRVIYLALNVQNSIQPKLKGFIALQYILKILNQSVYTKAIINLFKDINQSMRKTTHLIIALLFLVATVYSIFPTPKNQIIHQGQFLQVPDACKLRLILSEQQNTNNLLKICQDKATEPRYYLNKVLKRRNDNLHCSNDKIIIEDSEEQSFIDIKVIVDDQKIMNNEGYILEVASSAPHIKITVKTYSGYVYALQTLSQKIKNNKIQLGLVEDEPLVPHRGIMIDSVRHFLKVETIARLIESMPLSKLNILHWHLSDDEAFTIQLASHPELAEASAFKKGQFYTIEQVKMLIDLAKKNGVSIIPEIDTPGHVRAWGLDKKWKDQNITVLCPRGQGYNNQLDLSKQAVYQLGQQVYREIDNLFRDSPYIHLGGDQVFGSCWDLRPSIKTFMASKGIKDYGELQMYWRYEMKQALPKDRTVVFWRNDAENVKIADNDIIQYWGAQADAARILGNSTSKIIMSTSDYLYLNNGVGNIWFNSSAGTYHVWKQIYQGFQLFPQGVDKSKIIGAEVALWGEVSNDDLLENNLWMRATAFAEKLWTDQPQTIKELVKGIVVIHNELIKLGVSPSPIVSEFCELNTDKCLLS